MSEGTARGQCRGARDSVDRIRLVYILAYRHYRERQEGHPCDYGRKPIPVWDGGRTARAGSRRPVWYDLAEFAGRHNISPETLVHAAFEHFQDHDAQDPPDPPDLMSAAAIERIERFVPESRLKAARALYLQNDTFATNVVVRRELYKETVEQAGIRVLNDPMISLSALYRHCVAVKAGLPDIAARFADAAFHQYLRRREAYDSAWAMILPPDLPAAAEDYYHRLGG